MPNPSDISSLDAILAALYESISGPAGGQDWGRNASLFAPGARLTPIGPGPDGVPVPHVLSHAEFVADASPYMSEHSFYETETSRTTERFEASPPQNPETFELSAWIASAGSGSANLSHDSISLHSGENAVVVIQTVDLVERDRILLTAQGEGQSAVFSTFVSD